MTTSDNPKIRQIRGIRDPLARARESLAFIDRGTKAIGEAREVRDEAIRAAYRDGKRTREQLAEEIGTTVSVVITALRGTSRR